MSCMNEHSGGHGSGHVHPTDFTHDIFTLRNVLSVPVCGHAGSGQESALRMTYVLGRAAVVNTHTQFVYIN